MKKYLICLLLFTFCFPLLTVHAQDTLVLRNGQKMGVKVISVTDKIIYSIPPSDNPMYIKASRVSYIKYKDGSTYGIKANRDTNHFSAKPYAMVAAGLSHPWVFSGYGADSYNSDPEDGYGYSGYANNGYMLSVSGGLITPHGWELTARVSYISNPISASGILMETISNFYLGNNIIYMQNANSNSNYNYSNYAIMGGITKNWGAFKRFGGGFSVLLGSLVTHTPDMQGVVSGYSVNNNTINSGQYVSYNFNLDAETQSNFVFGLDFFMRVHITSHIFLKPELEFLLSGLDNSGRYEFSDANTGQTLSTGYYTGGSYTPSSFFVGLTHLNIGAGYEF